MVHVAWGIIIACGKTEQLSADVDIPFLNLGSRPVIAYSLEAYEKCPDIAGIAVVVSKERADSVLGMAQMYGYSKLQKVVSGAATRHTAMQNALKAIDDDDVSILSVHDASRPCVTSAIISETIKAAKRYGSGIAAVQMREGVKMVEKGLTVSQSLTQGTPWAAQTPQTYKREVLEKGYAAVSKKKLSVDDDSLAVGLTKAELHLVESSHENMKICSATDFNIAACMLKV